MSYTYHDGTVPTAGNSIWVFAANLAGAHVRGHARTALKQFDAQRGVGDGPSGRAYAIPIKDANFVALPSADVAWHVRAFLSYARAHPHHSFFVTSLTNDLVALTVRRMAPLFRGAPANCVFPQVWQQWLETPA